MFGYFEGAIQSDKSINIMLGRMAAAVKFVISAKDASFSTKYQIKSIEIVKAAVKSHFFPHNSTNNLFGNNMKESFTPSNYEISNTSTEFVYYYQIGENISPSSTNRTKVIITANRKNTEKKYTVDLGCDQPGTPNRNYSLYRNNNYTFNIVLNN